MKWIDDTHGITDAGHRVEIMKHEGAAITLWKVEHGGYQLVGPDGTGFFRTIELARTHATKWIEAAEAASRAVEFGQPRVVWAKDLEHVRDILVTRAAACADGTAGRYVEAIDLIDELLRGGK